MTAGWGETEVFIDVSSRRLAPVLHRHLAKHGLLSFLRLLRAFLLNVVKRNQGILRNSDQNLSQSEAYSAGLLPAGPKTNTASQGVISRPTRRVERQQANGVSKRYAVEK